MKPYRDLDFVDRDFDELATLPPDDRLSVLESPSRHIFTNVEARIPASTPARHVEYAPGTAAARGGVIPSVSPPPAAAHSSTRTPDPACVS